MKVELIYDEDCPNIADARQHLVRAFSGVSISPKWTEWDRNDPDSPEHARKFGSPTILVNGVDVSGEQLTEQNCCRIYSLEGGRSSGVPPVAMIAAALKSYGSGTKLPWNGILAAIPGVGVALLPKLTCAACWPVYAGLMSSMGIGFFNYSEYLVEITVVALAIALFALAFRAKRRRGYKPLMVGILASIGRISGKFWVDSSPLVYLSVGLLITASFWNSWPKKNATCSACP